MNVFEEEIHDPTPTEKALRAALAEAHGAEDTLRQVQAVTAAFCEAASPQDIANTIVTTARDTLAASASVAYLMTEDGHLELAAYRGLSRSVERLKRMPFDTPLPLAEAIRRRAPLFYSDRNALLAEYPHLAHGDTPPEALQAVAALPLISQGRVLGGAAFSFPKTWRFREPDRAMLTAMMQQASHALLRAKLYENERRMREERERLVRELTETVRHNELFAGVLAHDLRNPLSAMVAAAQVALIYAGDERVAKSLRIVLTSGARMGRMVEQLLDFTSLRVGKGLVLHRGSVDLANVCRDVIAELEKMSAAGAVRLSQSGETTGRWDADRLSQVFSNLVGNAVEHGEPGTVELHLDGSAPDCVVVSVHNRGAIPDATLPILFDPFRGAQRRSAGRRGFGLGLFISKQFVLAHGGTIEVSSANGSTELIVRLPR